MVTSDRAARRVTRTDVARRAGVSPPVVSYTLSGSAPVAPETAARVMRAIEELGYRPNQTARALKDGTSRTLALIVPDQTNPFFAELAREIERVARRRGYALFLSSPPSEEPGTMQHIVELAARQVDGVMIVPGGIPVSTTELRGADLPWVLVDASVSVPGGHTIGVDLYAGAHAGVTHLIDHGISDIWFVGDVAHTELRRVGWLDACREHGLVAGRAVVSAFSREGGYLAAGQLLDGSAPMPGALFVASDMIAIGMLKRFHEAGITVPDDVAIVSFDGSWASEFSTPALTTIRQPVQEMAEAAVASAVDDPTGESHRILAGDLIVRDSCGRHPA